MIHQCFKVFIAASRRQSKSPYIPVNVQNIYYAYTCIICISCEYKDVEVPGHSFSLQVPKLRQEWEPWGAGVVLGLRHAWLCAAWGCNPLPAASTALALYPGISGFKNVLPGREKAMEFLFLNHAGSIALISATISERGFCQFCSSVSCISHAAHLKSQQSAAQPAVKSSTFRGWHIHLPQEQMAGLIQHTHVAVNVPSPVWFVQLWHLGSVSPALPQHNHSHLILLSPCHLMGRECCLPGEDSNGLGGTGQTNEWFSSSELSSFFPLFPVSVTCH